MKRLPLIIIFALLSFLSHAQKKDLSLNLKVGEIYKQITKAHMVLNQNYLGQDMQITIDVSGAMAYKVLSESKGIYEMEASFTSLSMTMNMPGSAMDFSSEDSDENNIFSSILANMVNKPFYMSMSEKGKVSNVKNVEAMWDSVIADFDMPAEQKDQIKDQMLKDYGSESIRESTEATTALFPEQAVSVGDSWAITSIIGSGFKLDVNTTYTLKEVEKDYYLIEGDAQLISVEKESVDVMEPEFDLKGTMTSTIKVDAKTGWVIESNVSQSLEGQTIVLADPTTMEKMEIPITIESKTSITNQ